MSESIELTVVSAEINKPGFARINASIYDQLNINEDHMQIIIYSKEKTIIRKLIADEFIDKQAIFLNEDAREKLGVDDGDKVTIIRHK